MNLLKSIHHYDLMTFDWCLRRKFRAETIIFSSFVSHTADGHLYILIGLLIALLGQWALLELFLLAFLIERFCYFFAKAFFKRDRPPAAIPGFKSLVEPSDQFSFPSGHTSAAFLFACGISSAYPFLGWILYPWACSVGAARVVLGVHFPSDIVAGAAMGHAIFTLFLVCGSSYLNIFPLF